MRGARGSSEERRAWARDVQDVDDPLKILGQPHVLLATVVHRWRGGGEQMEQVDEDLASPARKPGPFSVSGT